MCTPPYTLILCVKSSVLYTCGSSVEDREGRLTAGGRVDSSQKFSSNASRCVITSSVRNSCSLPGCRYLFLYMRAAWRSLSTMKQRQSSFWGSRRAPAAYKPPLPPPNFAHNSDVWFNTLPKYLKPNKQCLTENQQTKQRRLRAFVPDHKPKSEKSVWILIKRLIVEIPFRGRSYQNSCFAQDTCFSLFLWRFKSVWRLDSIMSQLHTVECVGSVTILYGPSIQTKKRALYRNRTGCVCATTFFGNLETVYSQTQGDVCITYIYIFSDQRNHIQ